MPPSERRWTAVLADGARRTVHASPMTLGWSSWTTDPRGAWFADTEAEAVRVACARSWSSPAVELVREGEPTRADLAARLAAAEQRAAEDRRRYEDAEAEHARYADLATRVHQSLVRRGTAFDAARAEAERLAADALAAGLAECERLRAELRRAAGDLQEAASRLISHGDRLYGDSAHAAARAAYGVAGPDDR